VVTPDVKNAVASIGSDVNKTRYNRLLNSSVEGRAARPERISFTYLLQNFSNRLPQRRSFVRLLTSCPSLPTGGRQMEFGRGRRPSAIPPPAVSTISGVGNSCPVLS